VRTLQKQIDGLRREVVRNVDAGDSLLVLDWTATLQKGLSPGYVLEMLNRHAVEMIVATVPLAVRYEYETQLGIEVAKEMAKVPETDPLIQLRNIEAVMPDIVDRTSIKVVGSTVEAAIPINVKTGLVTGI
jgi:hypothetical protein